MKSISYVLGTALLLVFTSCSSVDENKASENDNADQSRRYDQLLSEYTSQYAPLPEKAINEANPANPAKIKLGHMLYYDTRLSLTGNNSCNSCHNLKTYGVDNLATSPGDLGELGDRNSPTTLNAALHTTQFWDGRAADVEEQAGGPLLNPVEMNIPSKSFMEQRLKEIDAYVSLFAEAFPEEATPISYENIQKAIGAFERELLTPARIDSYLKGDKDALSLREKKGMLSFNLIGCNTCHNGALFGGNQFQRFGVFKPYWEATGSTNIDRGIAAITDEELDEYMFKVPTLRNVTETHPYFHDGSVKDLSTAVKIMADVQLDYQMTSEEVKNVVAFLEALKGEVPEQYQINPLASSDL
ncbi:MAG: cytochrome-c peroxidase [Cryomorphaceae bacterium]